MPTTLNVNEAKTHFSSVVSEVEKNLVAFTIMRYGRPVARIVPLESPRRTFKPIPGLAGKVKVKCDLFDDSSCDWGRPAAMRPDSFVGRGHVQGDGAAGGAS